MASVKLSPGTESLNLCIHTDCGKAKEASQVTERYATVTRERRYLRLLQTAEQMCKYFRKCEKSVLNSPRSGFPDNDLTQLDSVHSCSTGSAPPS